MPLRLARARLFYFCMAVLCLSHAAYADGYGAIAWSAKTRIWGSAYGFVSDGAAENAAISRCAMADCKWVAWVRNGFTAVSAGEDGEYGWAVKNTKEEAVDASMTECRKRAKNCELAAWVSSFDSDPRSGGATGEMSSAKTLLARMGGAFEYTIADFQGFRQIESNWCWAAVSETIFFSLTGYHLDQAELARIQPADSDAATTWQSMIEGVEANDCHSSNGASNVCNHRGYVGPVLAYLGKAYPKPKLPDSSDPVGILRLIRNSLEAKIPVGIVVEWDQGTTHALAVYGAKYYIDNGTVKTRFKVYDPYDNSYNEMDESTYYAANGGRGRFSWHLSPADFRRQGLRQITERDCQFLIPEERNRICNH